MQQLKLTLIGMIMATELISQSDAIDQAQSFYTLYQSQITSYVEAHVEIDLVTAVTNDETHTWLDNIIAPGPPPVDIRGYFLNEIVIPSS